MFAMTVSSLLPFNIRPITCMSVELIMQHVGGVKIVIAQVIKFDYLVNLAPVIVVVANGFSQLVQIHFPNPHLVLMNPSRVVGFGDLLLLLTNHTLMLTLQMFWTGLKNHSFHLGEILMKKLLPIQICKYSSVTDLILVTYL